MKIRLSQKVLVRNPYRTGDIFVKGEVTKIFSKTQCAVTFIEPDTLEKYIVTVMINDLKPIGVKK